LHPHRGGRRPPAGLDRRAPGAPPAPGPAPCRLRRHPVPWAG
jgi:hypothetical protein